MNKMGSMMMKAHLKIKQKKPEKASSNKTKETK